MNDQNDKLILIDTEMEPVDVEPAIVEIPLQSDAESDQQQREQNGLDEGKSDETAGKFKLVSTDELKRLLLEHWSQLTAMELLTALICTLGLLFLVLVLTVALLRASLSPAVTVCDKRGCIEEGARLATVMNTSADPCQDFFEFACGNFGKANPLGVKGEYGMSFLLLNQNQKRIEELLLQEHVFYPDSAFSKLRLHYSKCVLNYHKSSSAAELMNLVQELGGWDLLDNFNSANWDFSMRYMYKLLEQLGSPLFVGLTYYTSQNLVQLTRPGFMTYHPYDDDDKKIERTKNFRQLLIKIMTKIQSSEGILVKNTSCGALCEPEHIVDDIIAVDEKLKEIWNGADNNYVKISLSELHKASPSFLWRQLMRKTFGKSIINNDASVLVPGRSFLANLENYIKTTNASSLNNYMMWSVTRRYLEAMGPEYVIMDRQLRRVVSNTHEFYLSRNMLCIRMLETNMQLAIRALMVHAHIGVDNIDAARSLIQTANSSLARSFSWMTPTSERKSLKNLIRMHVDYGVTPLVKSLDRLNDHYMQLRITPDQTFFQMLKSVYSFHSSELRTRATSLTSKERYDNIFLMGNAVSPHIGYDSSNGVLHIPPGLLQIPAFDRDLPEYVNMAGVGASTISSLLQMILLYQTRGNWDKETTSRFEEYLKCIDNNFRHYRFPHGRIRLFEILSRLNWYDPGVYITTSHMSFLLAEQEYPAMAALQSSILPGEHVTSTARQFYLSFAQYRCQVTDDYGIRTLAENGLYPQREIVNNFMANSPGFQEAYGCSAPPEKHKGKACSLGWNL